MERERDGGREGGRGKEKRGMIFNHHNCLQEHEYILLCSSNFTQRPVTEGNSVEQILDIGKQINTMVRKI